MATSATTSRSNRTKSQSDAAPWQGTFELDDAVTYESSLHDAIHTSSHASALTCAPEPSQPIPSSAPRSSRQPSSRKRRSSAATLRTIRGRRAQNLLTDSKIIQFEIIESTDELPEYEQVPFDATPYLIADYEATHGDADRQERTSASSDESELIERSTADAQTYTTDELALLHEAQAQQQVSSEVFRGMMPAVLDMQETGGPGCMQRLTRIGAVNMLDNLHAYVEEYAASITGRAAIAHQATPRYTIACGTLAAWVWLGGCFPTFIDILSKSHYRKRVFGRRIRSFNRSLHIDEIAQVGNLVLTSPLRTTCDLALLPFEEFVNHDLHELARALIHHYQIRAEHCTKLLTRHRYMHNSPQARQILELFDRS